MISQNTKDFDKNYESTALELACVVIHQTPSPAGGLRYGVNHGPCPDLGNTTNGSYDPIQPTIGQVPDAIGTLHR